FVDHFLSMIQRHDACDGLAAFGGDSDRDVLPHTCHEILKPCERLRGQVVARPCQLKQPVQLLEQQWATARFIGEGFPLRATDLTLNTILMKSFVQGIETRAKIQPMQGIGSGACELLVEFEARVHRTHFHIFPPFPYSLRLGVGTKCPELLGTFNEWLAMIGKRKRDEPATGQPATYGAE